MLLFSVTLGQVSAESKSTSSKMSMAEAWGRLLTQGFRRYLGAKSPPEGRLCHLWAGTEFAVQLKDPGLNCIRAQGTEIRKDPWTEDKPGAPTCSV